MSEEERIFFENLPETVTIYRGCSLKEIKSNNFRFSWSLDKNVADFFAFDYNKNLKIKSNIVVRTVSKNSLIAYFNGRDEQEVIYIQDFDTKFQLSNKFDVVAEGQQ
ncbi:hypothetical protein RCH18_002984 [Flavobacterium sp. PL11]|uniref:hypothetical protein n=1 Tax=Flavobacterium sp. PL11 TaxID=3071717 RepID=UPI002E08694B|nr:hypothetical protein [Flavobacterium sp. PL11]